MPTSVDSANASGIDLVEIPIGTFRQYLSFISEHDLWDEATKLLADKGIKSVILGSTQLNLVREFVNAKGSALNADPIHGGALVVPECSLVCPSPRVPMSPGGPGDGGIPDGGDTSRPM